MSTETVTPPIIVLTNAFYEVVLLAGADLSFNEVALRHIPLAGQQPKDTRWMLLSVVRTLIDCGAAVLVDRLGIEGAARGRANPNRAASRIEAAIRAAFDEARRPRRAVEPRLESDPLGRGKDLETA